MEVVVFIHAVVAVVSEVFTGVFVLVGVVVLSRIASLE